MTEPAWGAPVWCSEALVVAWLKLTVPSPADSQLITQCAAAVEPQVEAARPDMWVDVPDDPLDPAAGSTRVYRPDPEVMTAAVMLAAKVFRRRNSPGGMETSFDQVLYVARFDPEIERALRHGAYRRPLVDGPPPPRYCYGGVW